MPSLTVENYLKAILQLLIATKSSRISPGQLAASVNVSPGTVTSMLKTLSDSGLARYTPYKGVSLTKAGNNLALRMLRRHRLIELFLVRTLNLSWDQVHEEAENLEHAVSDMLIDRMDDFLGHPEADPHGDPIPSADGLMRGGGAQAVPLSTCPPPSRIRIVRVLNQQPEFLRYLTDTGLELGATAVIVENSAEGGLVSARVVKKLVSLGYHAAEQLLVETL